MKKLIYIGIFLPFALILLSRSVYAGIGVSPAEFNNSRLKPGTSVSQVFTLSQAEPEEDLKVFIEVEGEIASWIAFDQGEEFIIPAGEQTYETAVTITVPEDAELKTYQSIMRFKVQPAAESELVEGVSIVTGARIDINIAVTNQDYIEFIVRNLDIADVTGGNPVVVQAKIENVGNIEAAPTKATLDILDLNENLLESLENSNIPSISPNEIEIIDIPFDSSLGEGEYFADVIIYLEGEELRKERLVFRILEKPSALGQLKEDGNFVLDDFFSKDNITIISGVLIGVQLIVLGLLIIKRRKDNKLVQSKFPLP